jgi:hypothetical protein
MRLLRSVTIAFCTFAKSSGGHAGRLDQVHLQASFTQRSAAFREADPHLAFVLGIALPLLDTGVSRCAHCASPPAIV